MKITFPIQKIKKTCKLFTSAALVAMAFSVQCQNLASQSLNDSIASVSASALKQTGIEYFTKREYALADAVFKQCILNARRQNNFEDEGKCTGNLASSLLKQHRFGEALPLYMEAINIYEEHDLTLQQGQALVNLGMAYKNLDMYDSAMANLHRGIQILDEQQATENLMYGYNFLGTTLSKANSSPLPYFKKSLVLAFQLQDTAYISTVYNNLGNHYLLEGNADSAIYYLHKSLALKIHPSKLAITHLNLGVAYLDKDQYELAEKHLKSSYNYRREEGQEAALFKNYLIFIRLYEERQDKNEQLHYLKLADSLAQHITLSPSLQYEYLELKQNLLTKNKQFQEALILSEQLKSLKDSLANTEKQDLISRYEALFKVSEWKRAFELESLNRQQDQTTYRWIGSLIILVLIIALFYARLRAREAEMARVQFRELNHRTNNLLTIFGGLVTYQESVHTDDSARNALHIIRNQLDALGQIYQLLSTPGQSQGKWVAFDEYVLKLIRSLFYGVGLKDEDYTLINNMQTVQIHEKQCNALALIVNEVLTNAIKYGKSADGHLTLHLNLKEQNDEIVFSLKDEGDGFHDTTSEGEGSGLIRMLGKQLKATWHYGSEGKSDFSIKFKKKG